MDLVLLGGTVLTMDASSGRAEALAVEGGKIAAVGPSAEVSKLVGPETRVVHLSGRAVIPGIVDAHNHFGMTVWEPVSVDCRMPPLNGINEVKDAIGAAASAAPAGQWIWGLGFEALAWGEKRRVTREELDEVAPNNPVCIMDYYYHACYANSAALKLAGIDRDTPDPERGWILKDGNGEPDGTLWESAMNPVHRMSMRAAHRPVRRGGASPASSTRTACGTFPGHHQRGRRPGHTRKRRGLQNSGPAEQAPHHDPPDARRRRVLQAAGEGVEGRVHRRQRVRQAPRQHHEDLHGPRLPGQRRRPPPPRRKHGARGTQELHPGGGRLAGPRRRRPRHPGRDPLHRRVGHRAGAERVRAGGQGAPASGPTVPHRAPHLPHPVADQASQIARRDRLAPAGVPVHRRRHDEGPRGEDGDRRAALPGRQPAGGGHPDGCRIRLPVLATRPPPGPLRDDDPQR